MILHYINKSTHPKGGTTYVLWHEDNYIITYKSDALKKEIRNKTVTIPELYLRKDNVLIEKGKPHKIFDIDKDFKKVILKYKVLGHKVEEIKTECNHSYYIIDINNTNHVMIIPDDVRSMYAKDMHKHRIFRGTLTVYGGRNLEVANKMFDNFEIETLDLTNLFSYNIKYMDSMFDHCKIENLNMSNFVIRDDISVEGIFGSYQTFLNTMELKNIQVSDRRIYEILARRCFKQFKVTFYKSGMQQLYKHNTFKTVLCSSIYVIRAVSNKTYELMEFGRVFYKKHYISEQSLITKLKNNIIYVVNTYIINNKLVVNTNNKDTFEFLIKLLALILNNNQLNLTIQELVDSILIPKYNFYKIVKTYNNISNYGIDDTLDLAIALMIEAYSINRAETLRILLEKIPTYKNEANLENYIYRQWSRFTRNISFREIRNNTVKIMDIIDELISNNKIYKTDILGFLQTIQVLIKITQEE